MPVKLDKEYAAHGPAAPWEQLYAQQIADHFSAAN
jgi:hypothetical protein